MSFYLKRGKNWIEGVILYQEGIFQEKKFFLSKEGKMYELKKTSKIKFKEEEEIKMT